MQNNSHTSSNRFWDRLRKLTQMLVLVALGGVIVAVPVSAQSAEPPNTKNRKHPGYGGRYQRRSGSRCRCSPSRASRQSSHSGNKGGWILCIPRCHAGNCLPDHRHC